MKHLLSLTAALLLTAAIVAGPPEAQPRPPGLSSKPPTDSGTTVRLPTEIKPEEMTAEQLLEKVKAIRAQKAELEKQEQALMKVLTTKTDKLKAEVDALSGKGHPPVTEGPIIPASPVPGGAPPLPGLPAPGKQ